MLKWLVVCTSSTLSFDCNAFCMANATNPVMVPVFCYVFVRQMLTKPTKIFVFFRKHDNNSAIMTSKKRLSFYFGHPVSIVLDNDTIAFQKVKDAIKTKNNTLQNEPVPTILQNHLFLLINSDNNLLQIKSGWYNLLTNFEKQYKVLYCVIITSSIIIIIIRCFCESKG